MLLQWHYEPAGNGMRLHLRLVFYINAEDIHHLREVIHRPSVDAIHSGDSQGQLIDINVLVECDQAHIDVFGQLLQHLDQTVLNAFQLLFRCA